MDINKVTLIGRLTHKPEERRTQGGQKLASFSIATNYMWRDNKSKEKKEKTDYHRVIAWGKLADIVLMYLDKGSRVYCEGRLQYKQWRDKNEQFRKFTDIIADEIIMLGHLGRTDKKGAEAFVREEPGEKELVVEEA